MDAFYAVFERNRLDGVSISRDKVQEFRVLGRHVDKLRDTPPRIAFHVNFSTEGGTIVT